jgi:hypothetical protein
VVDAAVAAVDAVVVVVDAVVVVVDVEEEGVNAYGSHGYQAL